MARLNILVKQCTSHKNFQEEVEKFAENLVPKSTKSSGIQLYADGDIGAAAKEDAMKQRKIKQLKGKRGLIIP